MSRTVPQIASPGGIKRRGFLKGVGWTGVGTVLTIGAGGLLSACALPGAAQPKAAQVTGFTLVQISDTHIGFDTAGVNPHAADTMQQVVARINALPQRPALVVHTGDVSHLSKPEQWDTAQQILSTLKADNVLFLPGEHDTIGDQGAAFRKRFIKDVRPKDYFSLNFKGVHIVGLSNIGVEDKFGVMGAPQLDWLRKDLQGVSHETPVVVFAHVPLFPVYPPWGWSTNDGDQAITLLQPFNSVTVLNGHIHQSINYQQGNIRFHIGMSTAFPQQHPGDGVPGAYKLPADELPHLLGFQTTQVVPGDPVLPVWDTTLASPVTPPQ